MFEQPKFIMLCGLPGSGKSHFRARYNVWNCVQISTDDILEEMAAQQGKTYSEVFEDGVKDATKIANEVFQIALKENKTIVWDQTNLTVKKRKRVLSQVPKHYRKVVVYVYCDESERQKRLKSRAGKIIPRSIDKQMQENLEVPTLDEGWDRVVMQEAK